MGNLDDISLILTKAKRAGFFEDVKPEEEEFLKQEAFSLFGDDYSFSNDMYVPRSAKSRFPKVDSMLEKFNVGHGWTIFSSTAASLVDSSSAVIGSNCAVFTTKTDNTAGSVQKTGYTANLSGKMIVLWVKVVGAINITELIFYAGDSTFANNYSWTVADAGGTEQHVFREGEWTPITLSFADGAVTGAPTRASIAAFRVRARATNTNSITVSLGGIGTVAEPSLFPNGVISFACDDSYASQYSIMRPALDSYGWPATAFVIVDLINQAGSMTLDQLKLLERINGWEIAGHSYTSAMHSAGYGSGSSLQDIEKDIRLLRKWLLKNNFTGADHLAYPRGFFTPDSVDIIGKYFATARTVTNRLSETVRPSDRMRLRSLSVTNTIPLSTATALVDKIKAGKGWGIITIHDLVTTPTVGAHWATADFNSLLAYISAAGVPVLTIGEVINKSIAT